jgi:hypothetical protein
MEPATSPRIVPGRACGSCTMCCKVTQIAELKKPPGVWCTHAVAGKGCGIYADRPAVCRAFYCAWMLSESFGPEWKPDKAKLVAYVQQNNVNLQVAVDPSFPNAWKRPPFYARIKHWAVEGAERGCFVFVRTGHRLIVVLPDREEDIGQVGVDDEVVVARRTGPAGATYSVEVKRGASNADV